MKKKLIEVARHPLIAGSTVIFFGSFAGNIFNFLFNLFMSRNLSIADYGVLASLVSLTTLATLPVGAMVPTLIHFSASYFAKDDFDMVRSLYFKVTKPSLFIGTVVFIFFILLRGIIASFFKIQNDSFIILVGAMVYLGFIGIANVPLIQAKLAFKFIAFTSSFGSLLKVLLGVILVAIGFSVFGALFAIFIAAFIPFLLSFIPLRFLFVTSAPKQTISFRSLLTYGTPAALTSFALTSFITTDIVLVKHFFDPQQAGIYATLSLVGRVIFFFSAPITTVMFPLVTQKHTREENFHGDFKLSLLLVLIPSVAITMFYFLFPYFVIKIFSKDPGAVSASPFVGLFAIFITLFSLLSILVNFYLSIKKTIVFLPVGLSAILQVILISLFHPSFFVVIMISLLIVSLLLFLLLIYYFVLYGKKGK